MISGGGAGRKYLPNANAVSATIATSARGLTFARPKRLAQSSQRPPLNGARQPLRNSLAPQFAQKCERPIVGASVQQADYISYVLERKGFDRWRRLGVLTGLQTSAG
jgi:hypothetical protein